MIFSVLSWLKVNVKWIVIGIAVVIIAFLGNDYYNQITENARNEYVIQTLTRTVAEKNRQIDNIKLLNKAKDDTISERDAKIKVIENKLENISNNLGPDSDKDAAASLKEIIKRLNVNGNVEQ